MDTNRIKEIIRQYIVDEFLYGEGANLNDQTQLATEGVIDSLSTIKLVNFIETTFQITLEAHEAVENMDTLPDIVALVASKRSGNS